MAKRKTKAVRKSAKAAPKRKVQAKKKAPARKVAAATPARPAVQRAGPDQKKFVLGEDRIPRRWYNIAADLPKAQIGRAHV